MLNSVNTSVSENIDFINETLNDCVDELKSAGRLLMQNDQIVEKMQERIQILEETLRHDRSKLRAQIENGESRILNVQNELSHTKNALAEERAISQRYRTFLFCRFLVFVFSFFFLLIF